MDSAPARLGDRGAIALEAGHDQIDDVCRILESGGFTDVQSRIDYGGNPRVATGKRA